MSFVIAMLLMNFVIFITTKSPMTALICWGICMGYYHLAMRIEQRHHPTFDGRARLMDMQIGLILQHLRDNPDDLFLIARVNKDVSVTSDDFCQRVSAMAMVGVNLDELQFRNNSPCI